VAGVAGGRKKGGRIGLSFVSKKTRSPKNPLFQLFLKNFLEGCRLVGLWPSKNAKTQPETYACAEIFFS